MGPGEWLALLLVIGLYAAVWLAAMWPPKDRDAAQRNKPWRLK